MQPFSATNVLPETGCWSTTTWLAAGIPILTGSGRKGQLFQALERALDAVRLPNSLRSYSCFTNQARLPTRTASRRLYNFLTYSGGGL